MLLLFTLLTNQLFAFTLLLPLLLANYLHLQTATKYLLITSLWPSLPISTSLKTTSPPVSSLLYVWNATLFSWIMSASQLYGTLTKKLYDIWRQASVFSGVASTAANGLLGTTTTSSNGSSLHESSHQHRRMVTEIQQLFHGIDIYPTESQVYEMIQCASRCSLARSKSFTSKATSGEAVQAREGGPLTFGEFCFFASVLINSYKQNIPIAKPLSQSEALYRKLERADQSLLEEPSDHSHHASNFEVFLGGSCNPTRWRTEVVIPELKRLGITYYNPQVEQWGPELIELECFAKQNSEILFFVVDNQTRAIASMIEVAFLAATNRKLVLVINDLPGPKCKIVNDELSHEEYEMLSKGRAFLRDVVERQGIPIFGQIELALKSTVRILRDNIWPQDLTLTEDYVTPVKFGHITLGDKMISMFNLFNSLKNGAHQFTFAELAHAYRTLTNRLLPAEIVRQLARVHLANQAKTGSPSCSNTSSPSLSRSSSSDEPSGEDEHHFEMVGSSSPNSATSSSGKKPKSRSKKNRKMKKLSDIFPSESATTDSPLPPLNEIVITFDQFCCIVSELNEKARALSEQNTNAAAAAAHHRQNSQSGDNRNATAILALPGRVFEKVGSNLFNAFSIIKTIFSIPVVEENPNQHQHQQQQQPNWHVPPNSGNVGGNPQHPLHPSRLLRRAPSYSLNNSFPSRSASPNYWAGHAVVVDEHQQHYPPHHSSLPRFHHVDASPQLHPPTPATPSSFTSSAHSSYGSSVAGSASPSLAHLRSHHSHHHHSARSASPSLFRHRHSLSTSSPNHLAAPNAHPLAGFGGSQSPSLLSRGSSSVSGGGESTPSPMGMRRHAFHSSTSSITSLLYDNYTDLYIGGCLEEAFLNQSIIPLLKKFSITFSTLKADRWTSQRMIPLEAKNIEKSRVLLFLITKNSIDISFMIMAAHYVGLGYQVVLCIENIDASSPFVISDGKTETWLSTDAIKDYNRGRSYLSDLATKMGVPVFSDINESIQCCIEKILNSD